MDLPWLLAGIAGLAVVASSTAARRAPGPWAGILAAAPITPTVSVLLIGSGDALLTGIPVVTATLIVILMLLLIRHPLVACVPGIAVLALLLLPAPWGPAEWIAMAVGIAVIARGLAPRTTGPARRGRLPIWARFTIGAGTIMVVGVVKGLWPAYAGWVAMAPWLFIAGTVTAGVDGGWSSAMRVLHGGLGAALGIISFAGVVASVPSIALGLPLGWLAFALTAWLWSLRPHDASTGVPTTASAE